MQKRVNLVITYYNNYNVNLEKRLQNETLVAKIGFHTEENGPSKICATNPQPPPPPWIKNMYENNASARRTAHCTQTQREARGRARS